MRRSLDAVSVLSDDLADYDIISDGQRSLESSITDLGPSSSERIREPPPSHEAKAAFRTAEFSAEDIQAYVQNALGGPVGGWWGTEGVVRVYVDGLWDRLQTRDFLQLRQAKLAFPRVHLLVGVFADELCERHQAATTRPHVDRCEAVRHCRWVDEVLPDVPWTLDDAFLRSKRIDYVAIDEGSSVDPACDKARVKGYDLVKSLRKSIPIRRTPTLIRPETQSKPPTPHAREEVVPAESAKNTLRGVPPLLKEAETPKLPSQNFDLPPEEKTAEPEPESPFEEPKVAEFGTE